MNNVTKRSLVSMRNPSQAAELAAWLAILATGATIFLLISLHALSPEFSPSWRVISEYAFGHYAWHRHVGAGGRHLVPGPHQFRKGGVVVSDHRWYRRGDGFLLCPSSPIIHQGHSARSIRNQSVGAPSICSAADQPEPSSQQRSVETDATTSTMDSWLSVVWLSKLCGLLRYFCVPVRTGCLWPRR